MTGLADDVQLYRLDVTAYPLPEPSRLMGWYSATFAFFFLRRTARRIVPGR